MIGDDIYREVAKEFPGYTYRDIKKVIDVYFGDVLQATLAQKAVFTKFGQIGYLHIDNVTLDRYFEALRLNFFGRPEENKSKIFNRIIALKDVFQKKIDLSSDFLQYKQGYYVHITERIERNIRFLTKRLNRIKKFENEYKRYATEDLG